jgi:hypothetical protein
MAAFHSMTERANVICAGFVRTQLVHNVRQIRTQEQLKAIGGWKSGVVSKYVHVAAEDAKDVLKRMNERILPTI